MLTAADFLGDSPFVMYLGDNILRDGVRDLVARFREVEPEALIQLTEVPDPQHYGVAELDGDRVVRLIEKPLVPPSNMALVGVYMFAPVILDAARRIEPSARGELEITDAIQTLIDDGQRVESHTVTGWWKDTGQLHDMLEANHLVLEALTARTDGEVDDSSKIEGRVVIEAGAKVERSHLRGPVVIGAGAHVTDAYIGPYTAIGNDVRVVNAEIENSILLAGAEVENLDVRLADSLLGRDAKLVRGNSKARALRMIVGDNSEVLVP